MDPHEATNQDRRQHPVADQFGDRYGDQDHQGMNDVVKLRDREHDGRDTRQHEGSEGNDADESRQYA